MRESNYEKAKRAAQRLYLEHDRRQIAARFHLRADENFLYIRFVGRDYRIAHADGRVEWTADGFATATQAGFEEALTLFDLLCCAKEGCVCSGRFAAVRSGAVSAPGDALFSEAARRLGRRASLLPAAFARLGGEPYPIGDIASRLPLFDFLPVVVQFWREDDEFPPAVRFLWDENILDFMRFETTFYAAGHLLRRVEEELDMLEKGEEIQ